MAERDTPWSIKCGLFTCSQTPPVEEEKEYKYLYNAGKRDSTRDLSNDTEDRSIRSSPRDSSDSYPPEMESSFDISEASPISTERSSSYSSRSTLSYMSNEMKQIKKKGEDGILGALGSFLKEDVWGQLVEDSSIDDDDEVDVRNIPDPGDYFISEDDFSDDDDDSVVLASVGIAPASSSDGATWKTDKKKTEGKNEEADAETETGPPPKAKQKKKSVSDASQVKTDKKKKKKKKSSKTSTKTVEKHIEESDTDKVDKRRGRLTQKKKSSRKIKTIPPPPPISDEERHGHSSDEGSKKFCVSSPDRSRRGRRTSRAKSSEDIMADLAKVPGPPEGKKSKSKGKTPATPKKTLRRQMSDTGSVTSSSSAGKASSAGSSLFKRSSKKKGIFGGGGKMVKDVHAESPAPKSPSSKKLMKMKMKPPADSITRNGSSITNASHETNGEASVESAWILRRRGDF